MIDRSSPALLKVKYVTVTREFTKGNFLPVLEHLKGEKRLLKVFFVSHLFKIPWRLLPLSATLTELMLSSGSSLSSFQCRPSLLVFKRFSRFLLDLSALTTLLVRQTTLESWDELSWAVLGQAPNLKVVIFQKSLLVGFLEALALDGAASEYNSSLTLISHPLALFPALSTIRFIAIHTEDTPGSEWVTLLIHAFQKRVEQGQNPIARLRLERIRYFDQADLLRIKEAVPSCNIVWDEFVLEEPLSDWSEQDLDLLGEESDGDGDSEN